MNLKTFIDRPVLSAVISILIVISGVIGLFTLPVEQFPDIAPPTIQVSTNYSGASAETVQKSVIAPLEEAVNGVENMIYMTSSATNDGTATITIYFRQGTDPDMAAVNVQNRVSRATGQLPAEVNNVGVTVMKRQTSHLQQVALHSPDGSYDERFLTNYININFKPEILRIAGVGDMLVMGYDYSLRIWMKPDVMAQHKLVPSDITKVLDEQNIESATGILGENTEEAFQYTVKYTGRLVTPEEFGEIVIRSTPDGQVLRLKDVADVELGQQGYTFRGATNGHPGVLFRVFPVPGANSTEVNEHITAFLEKARENLPKGVEMTVLSTSNDFLFASINEVVKTLIEAIILVMLVVYLFLQDLRSTFIPLVGLIVSLVGTFAFMSVVGFSLNMLTLFALVLVIGTVVDDAIVVVEAVQARFDAGYTSPYKATTDALKGISNAVLTSSLVFMAVFVPVSFMGGTSGTFYTQFGLTMAAAVGISAINALTLCPALSALLLRPYKDEDGKSRENFAARFRKAFYAAFDAMAEKYKRIVTLFIRRRWLTWSLLGCSLAILVLLTMTARTGVVPQEDQGVAFVGVSTPPGSSLRTTNEVLERIGERIKDIPQIAVRQKVAGYNTLSGRSANIGQYIVRLKHWDERPGDEDDVNHVIQEIYRRTADIKDARIFITAPGMIPGYGSGNSLEVHTQDRQGGSLEAFADVTNRYIEALNQRPEIARAFTAFDARFPQWSVRVDAARCKRAGVTPDEVLNTLSGYYGGRYISNFNRFSRVFRVMMQAPPSERVNERSLDKMFVRTQSGEMAPLSQFVELTRVYGAETLSRFNMYNSIAINVMPAEGYSSGEAIRAVEETAAATLPVGYGYDYGGITREENNQNSTTTVVFIISFMVIYFILCALYESFLIPFAVLLSVPCGLMGSFLFARLLGIENNIYMQTGLIMLIGLLSKTAILLTEYAVERRKAGMSLAAAALGAAGARLRPVLMTVLTMVFGLLPLMFATGVGANGNRSIGTGAVGGIIIGTIALLLFVPSLFIVFQWLQERLHFAKLKK